MFGTRNVRLKRRHKVTTTKYCFKPGIESNSILLVRKDFIDDSAASRLPRIEILNNQPRSSDVQKATRIVRRPFGSILCDQGLNAVHELTKQPLQRSCNRDVVHRSGFFVGVEVICFVSYCHISHLFALVASTSKNRRGTTIL